MSSPSSLDLNSTSSGVPRTETPRQPAPKDPLRQDAPKRNRYWVWVMLLVLLVLGMVVYRMHTSSVAASKSKDSTPSAISVGVIPVQKRDVPYYVTGLGSVTAFNTVTVHSRIEGQIMKIYFQEGQFVKAGDVLAAIDPRPRYPLRVVVGTTRESYHGCWHNRRCYPDPNRLHPQTAFSQKITRP